MSTQRQTSPPPSSRVLGAIATVKQVLIYAQNDIQDAVNLDPSLLENDIKKILAAFKKIEAIVQIASQDFIQAVQCNGQALDAEHNTSPVLKQDTGASRITRKMGPLSDQRMPCPYESLIAAYSEILPELPRVRVIDNDRKKAIAKRWNWVLTSLRPDGSRRAQTADQALDWFKKYFELARENDFVMGRTKRSSEHQNWKCDIEFLMSSKGLKQVIEKTDTQ